MLLQPITVPFSKSTLKPSVYTLINFILFVHKIIWDISDNIFGVMLS